MRRTRETDRDELSDAEKRDLIKLIEAGKPLPEKYRFIVFEDKREVELVWNGKTREVCTSILPFQTLEHIDEPRKEQREDEELGLDIRGRQLKGWTNKLIWGDNKLILSSLKSGALRRQIEDAGGLKLIYIDPPFDVGADFSMNIEVGGETFHKEANILEQIAYRDTWGRGADSFIAMIYERLILMRDLLHKDGSIYVHCDWRVNALIRLALDEVFGRDRFKNEIVWHYVKLRVPTKQLPANHDSVFFYTRSDSATFNLLREEKEKVKRQTVKKWDPIRKTTVQVRDEAGNLMYYDQTDKSIDTVWHIQLVNPVAEERLNFPTQKPEALIERFMRMSTNESDLVADFSLVLALPPPLPKSLAGNGLRLSSVNLGFTPRANGLSKCNAN